MNTAIPALNIKNLYKTYQDGTQALKGIDLRVEKGDFFALLGPNGAGKSTTIGIITSLINPTSGLIEIFGHDLKQEAEKAKSCIGVVPQEFNFNIFETVEQILINQAGYYGVKAAIAKERTLHYLNKLGLNKKRHNTARSLSGGMKRRLMIARALIHEPKLLILDEPTAGVDIEIRRSLWQFIEEINEQGTTIILTTHYLEEAETLCRNIAIINHGKIIEHTAKKALLNTLPSETLILSLKAAIDTLPDIPHARLRLLDPYTIEAEITTQRPLNDLFSLLSSKNIEVCNLRNKTNRLEELFLRLTGKPS